jgi:hypothetical protein
LNGQGSFHFKEFDQEGELVATGGCWRCVSKNFNGKGINQLSKGLP